MGRARCAVASSALLFGSVVAIPRIPRSPARRRALWDSGRRAATAAHAAAPAVEAPQKQMHVVEASTLWWFVRSIPEWAAEEVHFVAQTHWLDSMGRDEIIIVEDGLTMPKFRRTGMPLFEQCGAYHDRVATPEVAPVAGRAARGRPRGSGRGVGGGVTPPQRRRLPGRRRRAVLPRGGRVVSSQLP
jgi:hypothetical protein